MNVLALLSLASAPAFALLTYFYLRNDYGSANWKNIIRSFVTGMLIVFPIMAIQFALTEEGVFTSRLSDVFVKTAFIEEFFKWFFLLVTMYRFKTWSVKYDGIVYSVALSLGFATLENFFLFAFRRRPYGIWQGSFPCKWPCAFRSDYGSLFR